MEEPTRASQPGSWKYMAKGVWPGAQSDFKTEPVSLEVVLSSSESTMLGAKAPRFSAQLC